MMDKRREEEVAEQGRAHAQMLISTGQLVLVDGHWSNLGEVKPVPQEALLADVEYVVWHNAYVAELQRRKELHTAETAKFPLVDVPLDDDQALALEQYEHALDFDKTDHSNCAVED